MGQHVLRRLAIGLPTLLLIITMSFFMMRLAPGGPFDQERPLPPEIRKNIEAAYHLDESLVQQYFRYLGGVVRGDFGPSYRTKDFTVTELLAEGAPASFKVGTLAVLLATLLGLSAGIVAALRHNSWVDQGSMIAALIGLSIPDFWFGLVLIILFGVTLGWLPTGGFVPINEDPLGWARCMALPAFTLAITQMGVIARMTRSSS